MKEEEVFQKFVRDVIDHETFVEVTDIEYRDNMFYITWFSKENDCIEPVRVITSVPVNELIRVDEDDRK